MNYIVWFIIVIASSLYGSDKHSPNIVISMPDQGYSSPVTSNPDVDEDSLCDSVLSSFYLDKYKEKSARLKPYLKHVMRKNRYVTDREPEISFERILMRIRSGDSVGNIDDSVHIKEMLLEASHLALDDKEKEILEKERFLILKEQYIAERLSKKQSALITTLITTLTTTIGCVLTYYSK